MNIFLIRIKRAIKRKFRGDRSPAAYKQQQNYDRFWITIATIFSILFASFLFPVSHFFAPLSTPQIGDVATEDIIAPVDFQVFKTDEELAEEEREVLTGLPAVLLYDQQIVDSVFTGLKTFISQLDSLKSKGYKINRIRDKLRLLYPEISKKALTNLIQFDSLTAITQILQSTLRERYIIGISLSSDMVPEDYRLVSVKKSNGEFSFNTDQVRSLPEAKKVLKEEFESLAIAGEENLNYLYDIGKHYLVPNLQYSVLETERRREAALDKILPEKISFKAGQRLVSKNQRISQTHIVWLKALAEYRAETGMEAGFWQYILPILSRIAFISFIFISFLIFYAYLHHPSEFRFSRVIPLLAILVLTLFAVYLASEKWNLSFYLFPLATGLIIVATLYDLQTSLLTTATNALLLGVLFNFNFDIAFLAIIGGVTISLVIRKVQRRSDFYRCALYLSLAFVITAFILESLKFAETDLVLKQCGFAIVNATVSTLIAMAALPLFESMFSFTTNLTLLELSDMNHPLLKRLAMEAPGTYHHSILVGNLAESASDAIGANSLLARVGAYYHDIGKMEIAEYFVENQFGIKSKHEELSPTMSALVISSHVKRGRELADKYDLPDKIVEFIEEHHGTSVMTYFYVKAQELMEKEELPDAEFRYPGPKPQSKETAIMMFADAVEAASRTLDDPKPSRIRNLVRRLMAGRIDSGELSNCDLTLSELMKIEDAFVKVLIGTFHARIEYPSKEEESAK